MDRRSVLRMLAASGVLLSLLTRKALGQADAAEDASLPGATAEEAQSLGLPSDWRFVAPRQWETVDKSLQARLNSSLRDASPIDLGGINVARSGKIEIGKLDPVGVSVELPPELASIVTPADEALSLEVLNRDFNPFLADPRGPGGTPLIGPFTAGGELYQGKMLLPVRFIVAKLAEAGGIPAPAIKPLIDALSEIVAIHTPAHQFRLGDGLGNRVVFYGETSVNGSKIEIGHKHIDQVVFELAKQNFRLIKQMVHFDKPAQGGSPEAVVADGAAGSTHAGGFSAGYDIHGNPMAIKSDWPSNYGQLGNSNKTYNAHLIAIDYSAGVEDPIPEATLKAYYRNADMWDCASAILVPFADQDPDPKFRDYMYNPLEVFDQQSARDVAAALATLDEHTFFEKHGAFYCAEGQYVVANLGPQEDETGGTLLKKSRYGDTAFGKLIDNFIKAPGYAGMSAEEREKNPEIGWEYLVELGPDNGGISGAQALILTATDRHGVALDWIPEDIKGWQVYRPKLSEALIARPMTVATIAWALLRLYMPRDAVARAIAADIGRAYAQGDDWVKDFGQAADRRRRSHDASRPGAARWRLRQGSDRPLAWPPVERGSRGLAALQGRLQRDHQRCGQGAGESRVSGVSRHPAKCRLLDAERARPRFGRGRRQARSPHRHPHLLQPRDARAPAGQEHGDEIFSSPVFRHVGAATVPRRDWVSSLCRHRDACQPEEDASLLTLHNRNFARGAAGL